MTRGKSTCKRRTSVRRGNAAAIYLLIGVLLVLVFAVLSVTVFFRADNFTVTGETPYTPEQVIAASGITAGENLLRLDKEAAERRILAGLPYVESAKVEISLPSTVNITVTQAEEYAYISDGQSCWILNSDGRVLGKSETVSPGLIRLFGVSAPEASLEENAELGLRTYAGFDDERTREAFHDLSVYLAEANIGDVTHIDAGSYLNISFVIDSRVRVEMGTVVDMEYKMKFVKKLFLSEDYIPSTGYAILDVSNTDRVSLLTNVAGDISIEDILGENNAG